MSVRELNQLWNLVLKNETTIAVPSEKLRAQNEAIAELRENNAAMKPFFQGQLDQAAAAREDAVK